MPFDKLRASGVGGCWSAYIYDEIAARDKVSLDIFWLRDESLSDSDNFPDPDILAQEIVGELETALEQFREIVTDLGEKRGGSLEFLTNSQILD